MRFELFVHNSYWCICRRRLYSRNIFGSRTQCNPIANRSMGNPKAFTVPCLLNIRKTCDPKIGRKENGSYWFTECRFFSRDPFISMIYLIPAWIRNHMPSKVCDEITQPFPNFNGWTVEFWEWISNFITFFIIVVITYPHWILFNSIFSPRVLKHLVVQYWSVLDISFGHYVVAGLRLRYPPTRRSKGIATGGPYHFLDKR